MDTDWFKKQQKRAGVTAGDIADHAGRSRSNVSHIYNGNQRMSLHWAKSFAAVLGVPLNEVLRRAGILPEDQLQQITPGFGDGDAAPFIGTPPERRKITDQSQSFGGEKPGIDIWTVKSDALILAGYLPGDTLLVDTHRATRARAGDIVVAQHYDNQTGSATTLFRRYEPPVLVAASVDPEQQRVLLVDGRNVVLRGVVIASWRQRDAD